MGEPIKTRVAEIVEPGKIRVVEDTVTLGPHDVAMKIAACGICAWEAHAYSGELAMNLPWKIGHEGVGVVVDVGSEVTMWKPGDRVSGLFMPAYCTYAKAPDTDLVRVPDHLNLEHAIVEPIKCMVTVLRAAHPEFGDHVLVVGCGFMGLVAVAGLKGAGVASLTAVDMLDGRLELAREFGATNVLNPQRDDVHARLREITAGHGIDLAVEASGGPKGLEVASRSLRRGRPTVVIVTTALTPQTYDLTAWQGGGPIVKIAQPSHCLDNPDELRRSMGAMARGVFPMDKLITHRFGLDEVAKGIEMSLSRAPGYIKGIVIPE